MEEEVVVAEVVVGRVLVEGMEEGVVVVVVVEDKQVEVEDKQV